MYNFINNLLIITRVIVLT